MDGNRSQDEQLSFGGWMSRSPPLAIDCETPLDPYASEDNETFPAITGQTGFTCGTRNRSTVTDGTIRTYHTNRTTSHLDRIVSKNDRDTANMYCTGVSESGIPPQRFEFKALESSIRMEAFQQQAARMSVFDENSIDQWTDSMRKCHAKTQIPPDDLNVKAASRVQIKGERKRKRHEADIKVVEDIKKRDIEKKRADVATSELSRNRSMFNGNKDTLPSIGKHHSNVSHYSVEYLVDKLPKMKESDVTLFPIDHDAISVISKHEARVRTACQIKDMGKEFVNAGAKLIEPFHQNKAPEIIESYEGEVGRPYQRYGGYPAGSAILSGTYAPKKSTSGIKCRDSMAKSKQSQD